MIHRLLALLTLAAASVSADLALAQGTFPAPLPGSNPPANLGVAAPGSDACSNGFIPSREDAERKGKMIRAASDRHASPVAACKLIHDYSVAEVEMIKYAGQCGIPARIVEQLEAGHKNTEGLELKLCAIAERFQKGNDFGDPAFWKTAPRGPVGDFDGSVRDRF